MQPGDRLICAFVNRLPVGLQFSNWPLHVTIVPWFRIDDTSYLIKIGLNKAFTTVKPFVATGNGELNLGPHRQRQARLLKRADTFFELESKTRNYLHKKRAWIVDETTKRQREFRPHVTHQRDAGLRSGETFKCDRLYIVEQCGKIKEVVGEVYFGKTATR